MIRNQPNKVELITPDVNVLEDVSTNHVGAGIQYKETPLNKGFHVIQHKHEYAHLSVLVYGHVILRTDDETREIDAARGSISLVIPAGKYHAIEALADSLWICLHVEGQQ